ncbi:hypothetical protein Tco_1204809 [Tanacetum coccineum]
MLGNDDNEKITHSPNFCIQGTNQKLYTYINTNDSVHVLEDGKSKFVAILPADVKTLPYLPYITPFHGHLFVLQLKQIRGEGRGGALWDPMAAAVGINWISKTLFGQDFKYHGSILAMFCPLVSLNPCLVLGKGGIEILLAMQFLMEVQPSNVLPLKWERKPKKVNQPTNLDTERRSSADLVTYMKDQK